MAHLISSEALQGLAAEHLVCADLCRQGYLSYMAPAGSRYDLVVDVNSRLLRVQVKSTSHPRLKNETYKPAYIFRLNSKGNQRAINKHEVDVVALVAMDISTIAYLPAAECGSKAMQLKTPGTELHKRSKKQLNIDQLPFSKLLEEITL